MMKKIQTIPSAEPFFLPGNKTGVVLIHGFTGAPKEMRPMGIALSQEGLTVLGVRLAGHATQPNDLVRTRWWDWMASVEDGINILQGICNQVFLAGLSLGGILAFTTAARIHSAGVIAMSTPYSIDKRTRFARPLSWILPWIKKNDSTGKAQESNHDHVDYPAYPARSLAELHDLIHIMHSSLAEVRAPVLLINSKNDPVVPIDHAEQIKNGLIHTKVEQITLEKSGHVITESDERQIAFHAAYQFIQAHTKIHQ